MVNEQTIEKLMSMGFREMAKEFRTQMQDSVTKDMCFDDRFGLLVENQWLHRKNNRIANRQKNAAFKFPRASMEAVDFDPDRELNRELLLELSQCKYIKDKRNILIMGSAGAGKTYLSNALGVAACRRLYKVRYIRLPELLVDIQIATGEGKNRTVIELFRKPDLLILDEWLHQPISSEQAGSIFEIVESRYMEASTIFVAQSRPAGWHVQINSKTLADAILDRIVNNCYEIEISDKVNMRERMGFRS
jgi:DNA replication protein DnaC